MTSQQKVVASTPDDIFKVPISQSPKLADVSDSSNASHIEDTAELKTRTPSSRLFRLQRTKRISDSIAYIGPFSKSTSVSKTTIVTRSRSKDKKIIGHDKDVDEAAAADGLAHRENLWFTATILIGIKSK